MSTAAPTTSPIFSQLSVPFNSTASDVEDPLAWTALVGIVTFVFAMLFFLDIKRSWINKAHYEPIDTKEVSRVDYILFCIQGPALALAMYLWAWIYYIGQVLNSPQIRYVYQDPQDTYSVVASTFFLAILMSFFISRTINYNRSASKETNPNTSKWPNVMFGHFFPKLIFTVFTAFQVLYVYRINSTQFPTSVYGVFRFLNLASGMVLFAALLFFWNFTEDVSGVERHLQKDQLVNTGLQEYKVHGFNIPLSEFIFSKGLQVNTASGYLAGTVPLIKIPPFVIVAYILYQFSVSFMIYGDTHKPIVAFFICLALPGVFALASKEDGFFIPYYVAISFYFIVISYCLESVRIGIKVESESEAWLADFQNSTNWNLMTTGPYYDEIVASGTSIQIIGVTTFIICVFASMFWCSISGPSLSKFNN